MFENALKYCKEKAIDLLAGFVPKTYSMAQEGNILGLYDDTFIITKQENLVGIISLQGLSYSNLMQKDLEGYFDTRQNVLNTISKDIQLRIVAKRRKEFINQSPNIDNIYAKAIITQFESKEIYKTEYFLVFETITSNVKSFFEKKKLEMTTSINEELEESSKEDKQENENSSNETHSNTSSNKDKKNKFKKKITFSATSKRALLIQTIERVKNALKEFKPTLLNSKEVLNFYAEYINGKYIAFNPKLKRLSDSYIASNVHFKKDYFVIEFQNQSTFCACVGIKNYESEEISSLPISTLLHTQIELDLIFHIRSLGQFESLNFLKTKKKLTLSKIVKADIDDYIELVQANRLSMQECALNLVIRAKSKAKLDKSLKEILSLLNNAGLGSVTETIGLKPHFVPKVYGDKPINVVVKRSEEVAQFIGVADENGKYNEGSIIDRMQKCEGKKSKKGQDNILSCTTDARKVALDYRLIDPNAKVEKEFSKSYAMAENIYENYLETNAAKGTQLGFIGLSTPKTHSQKVSLEAPDNAHEIENKNPLDEAQELLESLSSYDENGNLIAPSKKELENELKEKEAKSVNLDEELAKGCSFDVYSDVLRHLVQMGIPQNEIAFIHDAKTEEQKQDLFKKLNRGEVRVLLGSPAKMGVGTNVQERLVAMHELDCPWRPDELLQMEGRGIRQGNILHQNDPENFRMKIYRYATEKTYDSRMWQIIETKSKGIEQFRNAHKLGLNELEDFNMGSSNASEMKAEATGNPLIIEEVKLRAEIKNEEAKYKTFNKENYFNEENLKNNSSKLDYLKQELKDLETLQSSVMIPIHTEIKLYDLKNEESKDYELIKVKEVEPLKENASMSEELTHKKLKEQNKQIAEQNKEKLDAIKKQFASNLNDLFFNEERDCKLLEYKGFVVNAYKTKYQVEFSLSPKDNPNIAYSPSNMVYKNDTANMFSSYNFCGEIKFDGFLKRLDNAITKLPEKIKELENSIETTQENIAKYTRLVEQKPPYPRLEYLQALKWDHKTLIDDLAKMSKDRDYKPVFNPKSQEVLEKMNAEKRASLVDESKEQGVKGNTKSHDEIEPATEQVIEKEIEKRAEIIYSKEVAITNNVDYYENEQEVEITKSRGRR